MTGDMLISALKVLLQDSVFAGGRSLEDKIASAQLLVDRIMQKENGVNGKIDKNKPLLYTLQCYRFVIY